MSEKTDYKWLQVRLTEEERDVLRQEAEVRNVDMSTLVRAALNYVIEHRPVLEIRHAGKLLALASKNA